MRAELVGVGTELLLGQIANTNAQWMSDRLASIGVDVLHHQVVGDNLERIQEVLRLALERSDVVLVTGGLGPTEDDITRDALAAMLGVGMRRHPEIEQLLRSKFDRFGASGMPTSNLRQADVPEGCRYIVPIRGTAPGLIAEFSDGGQIYAMPGVPAEMMEMMENTVLPELAARSRPVGARLPNDPLHRRRGVARRRAPARPVHDAHEPDRRVPRVLGEAKVRLTAKAETAEEAERVIAPVADEVVRRLGDVVFSTDDESPRAGRRTAAARTGPHARDGGVDHGRGRRRADQPRSRFVRDLRRRRGDVHARGQGARAGRVPRPRSTVPGW